MYLRVALAPDQLSETSVYIGGVCVVCGGGEQRSSERASHLPKHTQGDGNQGRPRSGPASPKTLYLLLQTRAQEARLTIFHFNNDGTWYSQGHSSDGPGASMAITAAVSHSLYPNPRQRFRKFN